MPFQLSPGVAVVEKDLTSIVPSVATSPGAFAGVFQWGPVMDPVTVTSENVLVERFGKPNNNQDVFSSFFTAANFLSYTNNLLVVRADTANQKNASTGGFVTGVTISAGGTGYHSGTTTATFSAPQTTGGTAASATVTVTAGVITAITIVNPGSGYTAAPTVTITDTNSTPGTGASVTATVQTLVAPKINNVADYQQNWESGQGTVGSVAAKFPGSLGNSLKVSIADAGSFSTWEYRDLFDSAPGTSTFADSVGGSIDEMHIVVIDEDGLWTGTQGATLEKFAYVSKASDAKKSDGTNNYYKSVLNSSSRYIWWMDHPAGFNWGSSAANTAFTQMATARSISLVGGADDFAATQGDYQDGFALFANDELYDVALIATGRVAAATVTFVINNVAEVRKDCVVFASPVDVTDGSVIIGSGSDAAAKVTAFRDALPSTSYAVLDSGFKYQYDRYNDVYRYLPLNGDIAGLCARTDYTNDPWFSPGGLNRGQIKNVVRLAFNPGKTERDTIYKKGVNPVVSYPGQGTVLFGDKTLLATPSAFDRINVRRLFIVLEKSIATAAKFQLFEFNDGFTRAQFKNLVEPFLRDVQGRRGITDFRVKCDESNNTGEVIDRNEFIADIFIKPNRSINFITLNFVAARSAISFNEIGA
jgi:Phage tail sheath protein subtilisin-like domain/Phage tail sheath C-terminal domain